VKGLLAPLIVLIVFALAVANGLSALAVFCAVLALAMLVSETWARLCLKALSYTRRLERARVPVGQETELRLEFVNAKPLPLAWLLVRDRLPRGLELVGEGGNTTPEHLVSLVSLRWYERVVRHVRLRCAARGVYDLGPAELSSGDVFGYRRVLTQHAGVTRLVVYPRVFRLEQLAIAAGIPQGEFAFHRRLGPDPLRFEQLRDYRPGDSPRDIHWRATARSGRLQTKEHEPSANRTVVVALDVQTMPLHYDHAPAYLEQAISAAASLAMAALDARWQAGLAVNGPAPDGSPWQYVEPSRHPEQAAELLTALAGLTPYRGDAFEVMLGALQARLPAGASVIGVTALPREAAALAMLGLRQAHHPVSLYIVGSNVMQPLSGLDIVNLGGPDAWERLQTLAVG
jgi:uncharacterized protein (DUF58 family)